MKTIAKVVFISFAALTIEVGCRSVTDTSVDELRSAVSKKGWILYSSRSSNGSWDIYASRPDGSSCRAITDTEGYEEVAPRLSANNNRLFYRRLARGDFTDHGSYGQQGVMVISDVDGENPLVLGQEGQYCWAVLSPNGKEICCLTKREIQVVDIASRRVLARFDRQGVYWIASWSPDGKWICGVANTGEMWTTVRINVATGDINIVREYQNCTPDWFPNSKQIVFSSRPAGQTGNDGHGWTQLWMADSDGQNHKLIYGEDGFHIYGGALSPDRRFVIFTKHLEDGAGITRQGQGALMCIMYFANAPMIGGDSPSLRKVHPGAKSGPILELTEGFEPYWTFGNIFDDGALEM